MVWNGLMPPVTPPVLAAVLVNWPVMNGTSCATLRSASWLSMVTAEGVERTLVLVSPRSARSVAAKFTPVPAMRPMPIVVPCRSALEALAGFWMAAARSTMLVPPTGLTKAPAGTLLPFEKASNVPAGAFVSPVGGTSIVDLAAAIQNPANASSALLQGTTIGIGRIAGTGVNFAATLRALRGDTNTNVLSTPSAVTMDNQEADLKVAQEVPFITGQFTNTA